MERNRCARKKKTRSGDNHGRDLGLCFVRYADVTYKAKTPSIINKVIISAPMAPLHKVQHFVWDNK